ncbi:Probable hemoglobin and hemoglobin-haptoglobin-binding protein 2 precursor [Moraxella caprae]|uniref:Probable hemoglobin and hemoglobin-haptoglobin-binding protein 2 n=1 Tax=Moraxella caprae TaxID=90240 RepID=A0A378R3M3_9GAMM|nr:TonB-dependent hemoglobin/transferrin/lactoferrin family receptor [Moraxella caprae]STZ09181.1 Probable hemoglobin and hemoglobin-haptoglobin-binding protein 2 precursor [Moraxella caprae]
MRQYNFPKKSLLALLIPTMMCHAIQAHADDSPEPEVHLGHETITISRTPQEQVGKEIITRQELNQELIQNTKDLVRYSPDVGIADSGRRLKGFAMRGVEGNRVAVAIDGVSIPDSEENSLYERYGNFNSSRVTLDSELVRGIDMVKGADSFNMGGGSLGGGVNYRTLQASDLIQSGDFGGVYRTGYATKNNEWFHTLSMGYDNGIIDMALVYSQRRGRETESRGGDVTPWYSCYSESACQEYATYGASRMTPDPEKHKNQSYLAKLGWQINDDHRVGLSVNGAKNSSDTTEHSYSLTSYWRDATDKQDITNTNLYHEWLLNTNFLSKIRTDIDYQKVDNRSINYKGNKNWRDNSRTHLVNLDDRLFNNKYKRLSIGVESPTFGIKNTEHRMSAKVFVAERDFKNINIDDIYNSAGVMTDREIYTIQHPMNTRQYGFTLQDNIRFGNAWSVNAGLRYDHEKIKPQPLDVTCGKKYGFGVLCENVDMNGATFKNWTGQFGVDKRLNDTWRAGYLASTGYRNPTSSEMFFTFQSGFGNWSANPTLKAEKSLNHTLFLQGNGDYGKLDVGIYHSNYKDFLFETETIKYEPNKNYDEIFCDYWGGDACRKAYPTYYQQMVNADKAHISGIEFKGELALDKVTPLPTGFKGSLNVGYSRGKLSGLQNASLLSIQPMKAVLGLDYESPTDKWGVFTRTTYMGGKKAKDAQYVRAISNCLEYKKDWYGQDTSTCLTEVPDTTVENYKWLNKSAVTFDVFGYYNIKDNVTLRAGIYNVFDKKYHTWDSLRGINSLDQGKAGASNSVDRQGQGLERFYAPGRNYALSLTYEF